MEDGGGRKEGEGAGGGKLETSLLNFSLIQCGPLFQFVKARPLTIISPAALYTQPVAVICEYTHFTAQTRSRTATMREFKSKDFWRAVLAELVGMTLFIFLSICTAIGNPTGSGQEVKVSLAFGLAIATLAQSLGHISGAHLNPAVTFGMLASCQISVFKAVMYIVAQLLGSALASGILYGTRPSTSDALGLNAVSNKVHLTVVGRL